MPKQVIRRLTSQDFEALETVFFQSFPSQEASVTLGVICQMVDQSSQPESVCLGCEVQGSLVAAAAFTPLFLDDESAPSAYILAPLAVHQNYQRQGLATQLIQAGKHQLAQHGVDVLLVYGDPGYYQRHEFEVSLARHFIPPYPLQYEFGWQAVPLSQNPLRLHARPFRCVDALNDPQLW